MRVSTRLPALSLLHFLRRPSVSSTNFLKSKRVLRVSAHLRPAFIEQIAADSQAYSVLIDRESDRRCCVTDISLYSRTASPFPAFVTSTHHGGTTPSSVCDAYKAIQLSGAFRPVQCGMTDFEFGWSSPRPVPAKSCKRCPNSRVECDERQRMTVTWRALTQDKRSQLTAAESNHTCLSPCSA